MKIVVALGGNALLRRNEPPDAATQRRNVGRAVRALLPLLHRHDVVITHGNGPQIGLLALEAEAYDKVAAYPLDVLGAESQGMVGYLLLESLDAVSDRGRYVSVLTRVEVDPDDPRFGHPSKPIGPLYDEATGRAIADERGWTIARDGTGWRRVVPSPLPMRIVEMAVIQRLVEEGVTVICAGGGGVPVVRRDRALEGLEAVIDKDLTSAVLAQELGADVLLLLTDVPGVATSWGTDRARTIARTGTAALQDLTFAAGSMGPKVEAACRFAETGGRSVIASLADAERALLGTAGTEVVAGETPLSYRRPEGGADAA